jgi:hypothetical protein
MLNTKKEKEENAHSHSACKNQRKKTDVAFGNSKHSKAH